MIARTAGGYEVAGEAQAYGRAVGVADLADLVARIEGELAPRWVWADTDTVYRPLVARGVRVERATDLRLCRRIVDDATSPDDVGNTALWDASTAAPAGPPSLLDALDDPDASATAPSIADLVAESGRQRTAVDSAANSGRLRLLLMAESAGALVAAEIHHDGLPWSAEIHDRLLIETLGQRPPAGQRPPELQRLADEIRAALDAPTLNVDSPGELLAALRTAGLSVSSTRRWEIGHLDHPVVAALLDYKQRSRLHTANGWTWLDQWVTDGRFHPDYVPGGVVTGRWATRGSGALQLPKSVRRAVRADPGMRLVVADVAQLEPRILAGMSADPAMLQACRGADLYQQFVDRRVVATRQQAKIGMLAAMYGGVSGEAGELLPRMRAAFGTAVNFVEDAARAGERFERVTTWLGRTSPVPGERWTTTQQAAYADDADSRSIERARSQSRDWGRFTRNFVVQGTAAEWALCWLAATRRRLRKTASPQQATLVYFLHDEVIVHAEATRCPDVAEALQLAADEATSLLFGDIGVHLPLTTDIVDSYGDAR